MKLLALDTATEACSAAVWRENGVAAERYEYAPRRHAALIMPMIEAVLAEAGLETAQLDAIAFSRGPGAFTGVRIAAGVAQGLAFAAAIPIIPVSTLATLALGAAGATGYTRIAAALDARMGEIYWGTYVITAGDAELLGLEQVLAPHKATAPPGGWFGVGSGWAAHANILTEILTVSGWRGDCYPHAADLARLAAAPARRTTWVQAEQGLPVYLRNQVVSKPAQAVTGPGLGKPDGVA